MKFNEQRLVISGIVFMLGAIFLGTENIQNSAYSQTNSTANQTSTSSTPTNSTSATTNSSITTPAQTNSTANQTSTSSTPTNSTTTSPQDEASNSIKAAINETGEFLGNVTKEVTTSPSTVTFLNETSDALGSAYVEADKFLNPN